MGDTYARVMRVTEGPGDRRTARSRAPQRSGVVLAPNFPGGPIPPDPPRNLPGGPIPPDPPRGETTPPNPPAEAEETVVAKQAAGAASPAEATFAAAVAAF